jgi:hypothetical protein
MAALTGIKKKKVGLRWFTLKMFSIRFRHLRRRPPILLSVVVLCAPAQPRAVPYETYHMIGGVFSTLSSLSAQIGWLTKV